MVVSTLGVYTFGLIFVATPARTNKRHINMQSVCLLLHTDACVFITAVPITKLFARGGGGWRVEDKCYERLRAEASVN